MSLLYITADQIGKANHGAGAVTHNESEAMKTLGPCEVWGREHTVFSSGNEPWGSDDSLVYLGDRLSYTQDHQLVHFYAGTFSKTIAALKARNGCKVTYTAAAHSIEKSRQAHEELGISYNYSHLTDKIEWARYVRGYIAADLLIVPSQHSAEVMRSFGAAPDRIRVIPHGCGIPEKVAALPAKFTAGYLGNAIAPDKGLRFLFAAWSKLNYPDAILKIAGHDSTSPYVQNLWNHFGGKGNIEFCGWQQDLSAFYNGLSLYVQPSVTEGFGIECVESQSHARVCLCSDGAGGVDTVGPDKFRFKARDVDELAEKIDYLRKQDLTNMGLVRRQVITDKYTWDKIRQQYVDLWKGLLV